MSIELEEKPLNPFLTKDAIGNKAGFGFGEIFLDRIIPILTLFTSLAVIVFGILSIGLLTLEDYPVPLLGILCVLLTLLFIDAFRTKGIWDFNPIVLAVASFAALMLLRSLPVLRTGWQINAFIDHSLFSAAFLLIIGTPAMMISLYYIFGATPSAEDISHYPLILIPVILVLVLYGILLVQLGVKGISGLNLNVIFKPYFDYTSPVKTFIAGDWPAWTSERHVQAGLLNHLLGTGLLMIMTTMISFPLGLGAGIYLNEFGDNWFGRIARFLISSLRAVSLLILGLTAFSLVFYTHETVFDWLTHGLYFNGWFDQVAMGGSYLTASLVMSLLVIPIISSATEQGCRSLPSELREGSLALGASEETTLRRVVLPWALPNIVTAVILGCAEAIGSVAVLMFIAGRGVYGVGVFKQVTSLAWFIFDIYYGEKLYHNLMSQYQFTAGLLLLMITLGLGIFSMILKRRMIHQFRGG